MFKDKISNGGKTARGLRILKAFIRTSSESNFGSIFFKFTNDSIYLKSSLKAANLFERSYANASSFTGAYRYTPS